MIGNPLRFHATVADFAAGDTIDLAATAADRLVYIKSSDRLFIQNNGANVGLIQLQGSYAGAGFSLAENGGDSLITYASPPAPSAAALTGSATGASSHLDQTVKELFAPFASHHG